MTQQPLAAVPPPANCRYCGAPLASGYYFCLACATPHRTVESVIGHPLPPLITEGELIRKSAPHVWPLFWTFFGAVFGVGLFNYFAFHEETLLALVLGSAVIGITTIIFAALHWPSLSVQFKKIGFDHWEAWAGLGALAPLLGINYVYHDLLMKALGVEAPEPNKLPLAVMVLFIAVLPAVTEETAFRGLVQHWLQVAIRPMRAILLASVLFTVLHFSVLSAPYLFCVGFLLGWTKWKTGSLYPSMLIHFIHNLVVVAFF